MSNGNIAIDFSFQDRPDLGGDTVEVPLNSTINHFKKVIQAFYNFSVDDYQVQYDSKLRKGTENFRDFWSNIDNKEITLIKPSNSGTK